MGVLSHCKVNTEQLFVIFVLTLPQNRVELLGRIQNPALDFWYHICLDLDITEDTVSAAVNGVVVGQDVDLGGGGDGGGDGQGAEEQLGGGQVKHPQKSTSKI